MNTKLALKGGQPLRTKSYPCWPQASEEEEKLLLEVLRSGKWSFNGQKEKQFCEEFAAFCGAKHAFLVSNGSVSLEIALRAVGIRPGDEVIVPSLTWTATAFSPLNIGATVVIVDVDPKTWCINPKAVESALTKKTKAIIPVHLYNQLAPMAALLNIAKKHSLKIVEDCAHSHGARWEGKHGDVGSFSFQQSKSMTSGEGGALITNDDEIARKIYALKNCGRPWKLGERSSFGTNHRITEFQAAILLGQLHRFSSFVEIKRRNIELLTNYISIMPPAPQHGVYGVPITYEQKNFQDLPRDLFIDALRAEGIPANPPYEYLPNASNWKPGISDWTWAPGENLNYRMGLNASVPHAKEISMHTGIVLPHHLFLGNEEDVKDIARAFEKIQNQSGSLKMDAFKLRAKRWVKNVLS